MDPKAFPANLDPKLKETYERVMGVNVKSQSGPAPAGPATNTQTPTAPTGTQQQDPAAQMTATPPADFMDTAKKSQSSVAEPQAQQPGIILPVPPPPASTAPAQQPQPYLPSSPLSTTPVLPSQPQDAAIAGMTAPAATTQVNIATQQLPVEQPQPVPEKKKSGLVKTLMLFLGFVVFFLVYALVWVKVFNLTLPFSLPF